VVPNNDFFCFFFLCLRVFCLSDYTFSSHLDLQQNQVHNDLLIFTSKKMLFCMKLSSFLVVHLSPGSKVTQKKKHLGDNYLLCLFNETNQKWETKVDFYVICYLFFLFVHFLSHFLLSHVVKHRLE
jgi:hypothetical protein